MASRLMRKIAPEKALARWFWTAAAAVLLASLMFLAGCAGISAGGTGVSASPGALAANPASLSFGNVTVGANQSLSGTISNTGSSNVTVSSLAVTGMGFSVSGVTAPFTIKPGQSANFSVKFAPVSATAVSGKVTVSSDASDPSLSVTLAGTGTNATGQLAISPSTLSLGSVVDGSSQSASGSITATGANVTVSAATTNNSVFSVGGLSLPVTITAGQSVPFTITFSPQTAGSASATLTVTGNAQPTTSIEALSGTGTAAPTHSVRLSWNASSSSNITGYNVYRAPYTSSCGSYAKINSLLNTSTLYTDLTVVNGESYCFASTAVNAGSEESGYSNIVSNVKIPLT